MKKDSSLYVAQSSLIAALYVVLTWLSSALGLWEIRLSEALCVLPFFTPAAVPGLTIGCILANLMTGCAAWDIVFGSLATFIGAYAAYRLRRCSWVWAPWPNIIANTLIVPFILQYVYMDNSRTYWGFVVYMLISETASAGILGYMLLHALKKRKELFRL